MFIGSYISGLVPLGFSLRKDQIKQLNVAGSGLLIGTALSVIIPEGVSALYNLKNEDGEFNIFNFNEYLSTYRRFFKYNDQSFAITALVLNKTC